MTLPSAAEKAVVVEEMFDRIAPHYDRMNRLLTFGLDQNWRRLTLDRIRLGRGELVLDLACGTGDFAEMCRSRGARVVATDYAARMLDHAARRGMKGLLVRGDAMQLPIRSGCFDAVVCGFALRNFAELQPAFHEMARVLRPGGRIGLLEVDRPTNPVVRFGHSVYFDRVVPLVGRVLADRKAYSYLPESAAYLPRWPKLKAMLTRAGFADVRRERDRVEGIGDDFLREHGAVAVVDSSGPGRFRAARDSLELLRRDIDGLDATDGLDGEVARWPLAVGGFAFGDGAPSSPWQGFPSLRFFVPRVLWMRAAGVRRMAITYAAGRNQTPHALLAGSRSARGRDIAPMSARTDDASAWRRRVDSAVEAIGAGDIEKIVLARRHTVRTSAQPEIAVLLRELAATRPSCFTFLLRWSGRTFLGSSPERLLRLDGNEAMADALAGTAARGVSRAHDDALGRELETSAKERREHRIVVDAIRAALAPFALEVEAPPEPVLVRLPEAHHLHTPIHARLSPTSSSGLLDIAARLHPTPAVCGSPREAACRQLTSEEPDRGWYGGAVGWMSAGGDGELAVALRAALLDDQCAHVWAGAGIVEGSSPEHEFDETERKMASILPYFERSAECAA